MSLQDLLSIAGSVLLALGGGSAVVFALAKWLGGVWAGRILESEKAREAREHELLVRRRNAYVKLALALRLFLRQGAENPQAERTPESPHDGDDESRLRAWDIESTKFHEAYDEAALWATDEVMIAIGEFLDLIEKVARMPGSVTQLKLQDAYADCISSMRKDCGFPQTKFKYKIVYF